MNKFKKYCPNVWIAECDEEYEKGEIIYLETKYGKEVECEVYNLILEKEGKYFYSILRTEGKSYAERKAEYWEAKANEITLAMPESLEYFTYELEKAEEYHKKLKENKELRSHAYSLTYAKKAVNEFKKNVEIAQKLWGGEA